jgi:hypothetical protein
MQADFSDSKYLKFMERIKCLDDLYVKLSIGDPYEFIVTEENIKNIIMIYQKANNVKGILARLIT